VQARGGRSSADRSPIRESARVSFGHKVALLALLLNDREARCLFEQTVVRLLMTGGHHESLRVRPHRFVLLPREPDDIHASFVFALTEIRRRLVAESELARFRLECLVRKPEGGLVFRSLLDRSAHRRGLPVKSCGETAAGAFLIDDGECTSVDAARDERRARNEAFFREVNERIEDLSGKPAGENEQDGSFEVVCECGRENCTELIEVKRTEYESVRGNPRRFLVLPGHEHTDTARVVERNSHFFVVEKLEHAGEIAVEHDPRS
jgi:hypothetical protein